MQCLFKLEKGIKGPNYKLLLFMIHSNLYNEKMGKIIGQYDSYIAIMNMNYR